MEQQRKVIDCRWFPSETKCSLCITGTKEEVLKAAKEHAISSHGYKDSPQLTEELLEIMKNEEGASR